MANVGELTIKLKGVTSSLDSALCDSQSKMKKVGGKFKSIGKGVTAGLSAPIAGIGISAIMTGAKFEQGMNRVKALTQASGSDFDALTAKAKELGKSTMFSATQSAEAMSFLAMAGFKTEDVIGAMPGVLDLAAASQMDLGSAADITSNILTGFGKDTGELAHVNDVLVKAMTSANVDLTMLGESMKYVGPVAKSAGMGFEETAAAVALLGNAGIQGSMAGTSLRGAMTKLLTPSEDAATIMAKLGINAMTSEGNLKSFTEIVGELEKSGASTADMMTIFGQRAGPAMMALTEQGSGALAEMTTQLQESGGIAKSVADTQMQGMNGAITEMKSAFEGLMITISEDILPILTSLFDKITPLLRKFSDAPKPIKLVAMVLAGVLLIGGPLLILIGMMLPAIGLLTTAFGAMSLSLGPITLIVLGVAAAIAAAIIIWKNWDKIMGVLNKALETVKSVFKTVTDFIFNLFNSKWGWLLPGGILFKAIKLIKDNWDDIWAAISVLAEVAWEKISELFTKYFGWALPGGAIHTALAKILETWDSVWGVVKSTFTTVGEAVADIWDKHFGWLRPGGAIFTALTFLKDTWKSIWDTISDAMKGPINFIIGGMNKLIDVFNAFEFGWEAKKVKGITVIPGFNFKPFNIAKIPTLAKGGIVNSPTLAMIGEKGPEAVVPLGRGRGTGTTINVNVMGPTYGFDDFERRVSQAVRDGVRRGGFGGILKTA